MLKIGDKVFVIDGKKQTITEDVCVGTCLSDEGRLMYDTKENGCKAAKLVYATREEAEGASIIVFSIFKDIEELNKRANSEIADLRNQLYGEPEYPDLIPQTQKQGEADGKNN